MFKLLFLLIDNSDGSDAFAVVVGTAAAYSLVAPSFVAAVEEKEKPDSALQRRWMHSYMFAAAGETADELP